MTASTLPPWPGIHRRLDTLVSCIPRVVISPACSPRSGWEAGAADCTLTPGRCSTTRIDWPVDKRGTHRTPRGLPFNFFHSSGTPALRMPSRTRAVCAPIDRIGMVVDDRLIGQRREVGIDVSESLDGFTRLLTMAGPGVGRGEIGERARFLRRARRHRLLAPRSSVPTARACSGGSKGRRAR